MKNKTNKITSTIEVKRGKAGDKCEYCQTKLVKTYDKKYWYCPNEMCLWDEQVKVE